MCPLSLPGAGAAHKPYHASAPPCWFSLRSDDDVVEPEGADYGRGRRRASGAATGRLLSRMAPAARKAESGEKNQKNFILSIETNE
jgi:hypothetical protein